MFEWIIDMRLPFNMSLTIVYHKPTFSAVYIDSDNLYEELKRWIWRIFWYSVLNDVILSEFGREVFF